MKLKFYKKYLDIDELHNLGFKNNVVSTDDLIECDDDGDFEAIKTIPDQKIAVTITCYRKHQYVEAYRYDGEDLRHYTVEVLDPRLHVDDLDSLGYVDKTEDTF